MQSFFSPKIPIFAMYFSNICKVFLKFTSCSNVSPLGFSRVQVQCKVFFQNFRSIFFNICKVFLQHWQSIFSTFAKYFFFSKIASNINVFPLGYSCVRVQCKVFFWICFKTRKIGEIIFFGHFPKPNGGFKIDPKSQPISTNIKTAVLSEI